MKAVALFFAFFLLAHGQRVYQSLDAFTATDSVSVEVVGTTFPQSTTSSVSDAATILGTERDLILSVFGGTQNVLSTVSVISGTGVVLSNTDANSRSITIQYDGIDGSNTLGAFAVALDITDFGNGFSIRATTPNGPVTFQILVKDVSLRTSTANLVFPVSLTTQEGTALFSGFVGTADFQQIVAIQVTSFTSNHGFTLDFLAFSAPDPNFTESSTPTISNSRSQTPTISNSPSQTPTISNSPSQTPTISQSPTISFSSSRSFSSTATASISVSSTNTGTGTSTATATVSPIRPSSTPSNTETASARASDSPSRTRTGTVTSTPRPSSSPIIFVQPAGITTGEIILYLNLENVGKTAGDGVAVDLRYVISQYLQVPLEAVIVLSISKFAQASVIICNSSGIGEFINQLNLDDPIFDGTILESAKCDYVFWGVACDNPLSSMSSIDVERATPTTNPNPFPDINFTTFDFPYYAPPPPDSLSGYPSSLYLSSGPVRIQVDDDEYLLINVDSADVVFINFILFFSTLLIALLFI